MKTKLKLSVANLMHRATTPKATPHTKTKLFFPTCKTPQSNSIRFEDMYKQAIGESTKNLPLKSNKARESVKKMTPINSNQPKKESLTKTANTRRSIATSLTNSRKKSISSITQQNLDNNKENFRDFLNANEKSEEKIKINETLMEGKIESTLGRFLKCLESLNHCNHSHIREKNECFLSEREVDSIMWQMGYNIRHSKYIEFLSLLEVDIYGGTPSENLCKVLQFLEEKDGHFVTKIKSLPKIKIIDSNLEISISDEEGKMIRNYLSDFRETNTLFSKKGKPIGKNKEKFFSYKSSPKYTSFLSPNKNLTNIPSSERLSGFTDSEKKKIDLKETVKVNEFHHTIEESSNSSFLCKNESFGFEFGDKLNNFSKQLSGHQTSHEEGDEDLIELHNKLNLALKKSYEAIDYESENFDPRPCTYQNPYKYVNKPILSIDVNLGEGLCEKIIVYEGESAKEVSDRLAEKFAITEETKMKFFKLLESHLSTMLWKIDELSEEMITDRDIE